MDVLRAPLALGDRGPEVHELHQRLTSLGNTISNELGDEFRETTVALVEAFQRARGLAITGRVDNETWQRLIEASWSLGQRLLYLTTPYLRGDDVADLQVRLSQLGFDPGRIDGLFGPDTERALQEFQLNCLVGQSGVVDRRSLLELQRVTFRSDRTLVTDVRDRVGWSGQRGPLFIWGSSPLAHALAEALPESDFDEARNTWTVEQVAHAANLVDATMVISIHDSQEVRGLRAHYWSSYQSFSRPGEALASALVTALTTSPLDIRLEISGMAVAILRETRMAAVHIEYGGLTPQEVEIASVTIAQTLQDFIHNDTAP